MTQDVRYARLKDLLHDSRVKLNMAALLAGSARWPRKDEAEAIEADITLMVRYLQMVHDKILREAS